VVGRGPSAEGARRLEQLEARRRRHRGIARRLEDVGELAVEVGDDVLDEVLAAVEVAVQGGCGQPHLAGHRPQRDAVDALVDQDPPGGLLDLVEGLRARPVAAAEGHRLPNRFSHRLPDLHAERA
jgi:hypothetical protein